MKKIIDIKNRILKLFDLISFKINNDKKGFNKYCKIGFACVAAVVLLISSFYCGVILAYSVEYNGKSIALVKSKSDYQKAVNVAQSMVECERITDYAPEPQFLVTITVEDKITETDILAKNIIDETAQIESGDAIYLNGELVASFSKNEKLGEFVDKYLNSFNPEGETAVSEFVEDFKIVPGYFIADEFSSLEKVSEIINSLQVKTTVTKTSQSEVAYKKTTRKTDTRYAGDFVKIVEGQNGIIENREQIVYINGEEISREVLDAVVITEPIDEIVAIGTMPRPSHSNLNGYIDLIWPLKRTSNQLISSHYGDIEGRSSRHKGVDIASPYGTPIYAAQGGTVIKANYSGGYGNYIVIDHGNGIKTGYAHASRIHVSVGERVSQGQVIGAVGSTGNSTGNHLHFEIMQNDVKINPEPYLGIY